MPPLIKRGVIMDDAYMLVRGATALADVPDGVPVIVPLPLWVAERQALLARGEVGVWLAPADDPEALAGDVGVLKVIAVDFPSFTDGRGYSSARILREAGYTGELRAQGDVLVDQIPLMRRCGFDSFAPEAEVDLAVLDAALERYAHHYQPAADAVVPVWKLRHG